MGHCFVFVNGLEIYVTCRLFGKRRYKYVDWKLTENVMWYERGSFVAWSSLQTTPRPLCNENFVQMSEARMTALLN